MKTIKDFCPSDCINLDVPEKHPKTDYHRCMKYKTRVIHGGYHPDLLRCAECIAKPSYRMNPPRHQT